MCTVDVIGVGEKSNHGLSTIFVPSQAPGSKYDITSTALGIGAAACFSLKLDKGISVARIGNSLDLGNATNDFGVLT
jgi:hypothetical protein